MPRLTKKLVDDLEPGPKDYFEWDTDPSRFGVRVWPSGKKTYLVQYRVGRDTKRVKIANHGTLTVDEARKQARVLLGEVAKPLPASFGIPGNPRAVPVTNWRAELQRRGIIDTQGQNHRVVYKRIHDGLCAKGKAAERDGQIWPL